jgi:asparagine synthase (glutamine-hydrolysing)
MCGICGIYHFHNQPVNRALLDAMTDVMRHRGPDGEGRYVNGRVGFGHRRLSIIDLEGGTQPISNETDTIVVVFNGEIYNFIELRDELEKSGHVFKTRSDTEVIVHGYEEWGADCVKRFNGIFSFALWDGNEKTLLLARDHLGVKPLYYTTVNGKLLFASEIKAILQDRECPREVDVEALGHLFTFRYVPSPKTMFKNIMKLPPGHLMTVKDQDVSIRRFWNWVPEIRNGRDVLGLIEEYQTLMEDAIRLQLRSDVPVGLYLSSGIDSGAILAIMRQYISGPIHTFTIGFEGGEKSNETDDARRMAQKYGTSHSEMIVGPGDYEKYYDRYLLDLEEPVGNETAAAFYFVSKLASQKVKVALTGQGADEPWAGYHRHIGVKLSEIYSRIPAGFTKTMATLAGMLPRNARLKRGVLSLAEPDLLTRFAKIYSFYSDEMKQNLFQGWVRDELAKYPHEAKDALKKLQSDVKHLDPLTQMLYIDTRAGLPDDLLMVNDKTSMANSVESRVPFLDYRLVEFIESIPSTLKLKGFQGKYLHKKAVEKWLPKDIVYRKKKGFDNPIDEWLRGRMKTYVMDHLLTNGSAVSHYFNAPYIEQIVKLHESKAEDHMRHIYLLISFEMWHRQFIGT